MKHKKLKKEMNTTVKPYTLDTVPEDIGINQFYCYNTRNGAIFIGDILGKSATYSQNVYCINGAIFKTHDGFEGNFRTMTLERKLKCFLDYKRFFNSYSEYLTNKEKNRKTRKTKYVVDKNTFYCKQTRAASIPYGYKEFSTKDDAATYAYNGLQKLKTLVPKYLKEFRELEVILNNEIRKIRNDYGKIVENTTTDFSQLIKAQVKPSKLKENDILIKLNTKQYGQTLSIEEVDEDFAVSVKGFIRPGIAKLSNCTVLIEGECNYSYPFFFHYADKDKLAIRTKLRNARYILNIVENDIKNIESSEKYVFSYKPFEATFRPAYFDINYKKKALQDIKDYVKTLTEKENG